MAITREILYEVINVSRAEVRLTFHRIDDDPVTGHDWSFTVTRKIETPAQRSAAIIDLRNMYHARRDLPAAHAAVMDTLIEDGITWLEANNG